MSTIHCWSIFSCIAQLIGLLIFVICFNNWYLFVFQCLSKTIISNSWSRSFGIKRKRKKEERLLDYSPKHILCNYLFKQDIKVEKERNKQTKKGRKKWRKEGRKEQRKKRKKKERKKENERKEKKRRKKEKRNELRKSESWKRKRKDKITKDSNLILMKIVAVVLSTRFYPEIVLTYNRILSMRRFWLLNGLQD